MDDFLSVGTGAVAGGFGLFLALVYKIWQTLSSDIRRNESDNFSRDLRNELRQELALLKADRDAYEAEKTKLMNELHEIKLKLTVLENNMRFCARTPTGVCPLLERRSEERRTHHE